MHGELRLPAGEDHDGGEYDTDGHGTTRPQLVMIELVRAELAELELRIMDRISALEARLDHKLEKMNGRLWFAFSILAAPS